MSNATRRIRNGAAARSITTANDPDPMATLGKRVQVQPNGCWAIDGNLHEYAHFGNTNAHRWVYEAIHGPISNGDHVHHECENKGCINPAHLTRLSPSDHARHHNALGVA